jgi:hypothetical protein
VPAPEIEAIVVKALREQPDLRSNAERQNTISDRQLVEQQVDRIIVQPQAIVIQLKSDIEQQVDARDKNAEPDTDSSRHTLSVLNVSWSAAPSGEVKGILHSPAPAQTMSPETRDLLLTAIAKARVWIDNLVEGRAASIAEIAKQEGKVERHIKFLVPLAFASPALVSALVDGTLTADLKLTDLAKMPSLSWTEQERPGKYLPGVLSEGR